MLVLWLRWDQEWGLRDRRSGGISGSIRIGAASIYLEGSAAVAQMRFLRCGQPLSPAECLAVLISKLRGKQAC